MKMGEVTNEDVIYFEDMFQLGIGVPYIFVPALQKCGPFLFFAVLLSLSIPRYFCLHVWGRLKWMGLYEKMVCELVRSSGGAILATNEEMVTHMKVLQDGIVLDL